MFFNFVVGWTDENIDTENFQNYYTQIIRHNSIGYDSIGTQKTKTTTTKQEQCIIKMKQNKQIIV